MKFELLSLLYFVRSVVPSSDFICSHRPSRIQKTSTMNPGMLRWLILLGLFAFPLMVQAADDSPDIHLNTTAQPETTAEGEMVWGWADLHAHQFANLGFGGRLVVGSPSGAPFFALRDNYGMGAPHGEDDQCIPLLFGLFCLKLSGDPIGDMLRTGNPKGHHNRQGYPSFSGWPAWNTFNHQTMYYKWLQRAFLGGQKLMVMLAVSNELLCKVHNEVNGFGGNCKDMLAVNQQLAAIRNMESYVDRQDDGFLNGSGWYKVATNAKQARSIINSGAMAVVMGIEVDTLFNCSKGSDCTKDQINTRLNKYQSLGVRHVFPMHVFDNGFGGAAVYDDSMFNLGNKVLNGSYFKVQNCAEGNGNDFKLKKVPLNLQFLAMILIGGPFPTQPNYPTGLSSHCNQRGLTAAGSHLLNGLMERGMLIDVDHMSNLMFDKVLKVAIANDYPLVASHSTPLGITRAGKKAEGRRTDAQLKAIHDLGGMVALNLSSKPRSALKQYDASVPFTCSFSAQGWIQSYLYTTDLMQGKGLLASVGMGTDFNGFVSAPAPRFGSSPCGSTAPTGSVGAKVQYPFAAHGKAGNFSPQQSAGRTFNINQDGLAHVGLLPDFIEELKVLGVSEARLEPLFRSAEKYLQMWEKAESIAFPEPEPEPPVPVLISTSAVPGAHGWISGELNDVLDITLTLELQQEGTSIFYEVSGATTIALTESVEGPASIILSNSGETVLNYYSYNSDSKLQSEISSVLFKIDNTPPQVAVSSVTPNGNGWHKQDVEVFLDAMDLESGVNFIHYRINGGEWLNVSDASYVLTIGTEGITVIEAVAEDLTGKRSETAELVINLDKTAPTVVANISPLANQNGWHNTDVTVSFSGTDSLLGSGIDIESCTNGQLVSEEGQNIVLSGSCFDLAGNETMVESASINLDMTAPTVVADISPLANQNGWHNTDVTVSFSGTDSLTGSGIDIGSCTQDQPVSEEGEDIVLSGSCFDLAGNEGMVESAAINLDKTIPVLVCSSTPDRLWPPNNKMVNILNTVVFSDSGSGPGPDDFSLLSLSTSQEPDANTNGKSTGKNNETFGKNASLIAGWDIGSRDLVGELRAVKSELNKTGRLYTLIYEGEDLAGNSASCETTVLVPHSNASENSVEKAKGKVR